MSLKNNPTRATRLLLAVTSSVVLVQGCAPTVEVLDEKVVLPECVPGPEAFCVGADLSESSFVGMDLAESNFMGSDLSGSNFAGANLFNANFSKTDLSGTSFAGSVLVDANFDGSIIKDADFSDAMLLSTSFISADLGGSTFKGAIATMTDFSDATGVDYDGMLYCGVYEGFGTIPDAPKKLGVCDPKGAYLSTSSDEEVYLVEDEHGDVFGTYIDTLLPLTARSVGNNPLVAAQRYSYAFAAAAVATGDKRYVDWLDSVSHLPAPPQKAIPEVAAISASISVSVLQMNKFFSNIQTGTALATSGMPYQYLYYGRDTVVREYTDYPESLVWNSMLWGTKIGEAVHEAALKDPVLSGPMVDKNFKKLDNPRDFEWIPTPPTYQPPLGFKWGSAQPVVSSLEDLESCKAPTPYGSKEPNSVVRQQAMEVLVITKDLTEDQKDLARFWDDGVGSTSTPPGHWYNIARIVLGGRSISLQETASLYADLSAAVMNATILTWEAKHRWGVVRPVTYIQGNLDKEWSPYLMTPPHQEYPSGHAAISHAAAAVLESHVGVVGFTDPGSSIVAGMVEELDLKPRTYESAEEAAVEASYSRILGGIHYPMSAEAGRNIGKCVAGLLER